VSSNLKLRNLATNPWRGPPETAAADPADDEGPGGDDNGAEADADAFLDVVAAAAEVGVPAGDVDVVVGAYIADAINGICSLGLV